MSLWRKRIGGISPTVMEVVTYDYYRMAPADVGFVGITSNIDFWDKEHFDQALASLSRAADYLAARAVDFIIHFGTPLAVSRGPGYGAEIVRLIEEGTGVRATTSISSAVAAMEHLGIGRVAVASPYPREINDNVTRYLDGAGFSVAACETMDVPFRELQDAEPSSIAEFGLRVLEEAGDADGLYMPCPQWPAADAVCAIEEESGKPVVASDPADFFAAFREVAPDAPIGGFGRLLETLKPA